MVLDLTPQDVVYAVYAVYESVMLWYACHWETFCQNTMTSICQTSGQWIVPYYDKLF